MVWIPGGEFTMGTDSELGRPEEKPAHRVRVDGFWMDQTEVTNAQFRAFVEATGYVTTAEKPPSLEEIMSQSPPGTPPPPKEKLVPGSLVFTPTAGPVRLARLLAMVVLDTRGGLAASGRSRQHNRGPGRSSGRPRLVGRCERLRVMGWQAAAHRGRVGVRRPWRPRQQAVRLGRPASDGYASSCQHLAGRVPVQEFRRRRLHQNFSGQVIPSERVRPVCYGR